MKKMITTIFIILFSIKAFCPINRVLYIERSEPVRPYEKIWNATCSVESMFNPYAIGDLNLRYKSYGIVQIRQSRLDDYYLKTGIRYTITDMFDPDISKEIFMYYAIQYHPLQLEYIARSWNGGNKGIHKKSTINYWKKIKRYL
jgi:hypothetical protein